MKKKDNDNYEDPDFGPKDDNDAEGNKNSLYRNGELPQKGYPEPDDIKWVHSEYIAEKLAPGLKC
jgi:hypothetical protein